MDIYSRKNRKKKQCVILFLFLLPVFLYLSVSASALSVLKLDIINIQDEIIRCLTDVRMPEKINENTMIFAIFGVAAWLMLFSVYYTKASMKFTPGAEYGTAEWGNVREFNKRYASDVEQENKILSENVRMKYDASTLRNNNIFAVGGSGAGKTAFFVSPNLLNNATSAVYTDPKGSLLEDFGAYLQAQPNTRILSINLCEMNKSMKFNPFVFIRKEADVPRLIRNIMSNTTPDAGLSNSADPFWDKAESMYLQSIFYYIWLECPNTYTDTDTGEVKELKRTFESVLTLLDEAEINDDGEQSLLEERFTILAKEKPGHPAVRTYRRFRSGAGDTMRTVIICANSRFNVFDNEELLDILSDNEIPLDELGTGINADGVTKTHLFIITPDDDDTWNFVPGMIYTLMFQELYRQARFYSGNKLPIAVGCWFDEFANIKMPSNFEKILATCRSRNIFCVPILQSLAQIKKIFKDGAWEGVVGNCDTFLYLGGNEQSTFKYISEMLGKWTIDKKSTGESRGGHGSISQNYDVLGQELLDAAQVRMLPDDKCIILVRGEKPLIDNKWFIFKKAVNKIARQYGKYVPKIQEDTEEVFFLTPEAEEYYSNAAEKGENVIIYENLNPLALLKADVESMSEDVEEAELMRLINEISEEDVQKAAYDEQQDMMNSEMEEFIMNFYDMPLFEIYASEKMEKERKQAIITLQKIGIEEEKIKAEVCPEISIEEMQEHVDMIVNYYAAVNGG